MRARRQGRRSTGATTGLGGDRILAMASGPGGGPGVPARQARPRARRLRACRPTVVEERIAGAVADQERRSSMSSREAVPTTKRPDSAELRDGYAEVGDVGCITSRPATGRWSSCCTASRSSGTAGGSRSRRSWRRASASSRPTCAATTCRRSQTASPTTPPTSWPTTSAVSSSELGAESAIVVGHDWGGTAAWTLAMNHPEVVDRLAILNAAHPRKLNEGLRHPASCDGPGTSSTSSSRTCPSATCAPTTGSSSSTSCATRDPPYTPEEIERYIEAWSQPGAAKAMIDYYRAAVRLVQAEIRPDHGAHPGHLGRARSLPRPDARRAPPRRRAQPRPRRAPARRVALGPPRRGGARHDLLIDFFAPAR